MKNDLLLQLACLLAVFVFTNSVFSLSLQAFNTFTLTGSVRLVKNQVERLNYAEIKKGNAFQINFNHDQTWISVGQTEIGQKYAIWNDTNRVRCRQWTEFKLVPLYLPLELVTTYFPNAIHINHTTLDEVESYYVRCNTLEFEFEFDRKNEIELKHFQLNSLFRSYFVDFKVELLSPTYEWPVDIDELPNECDAVSFNLQKFNLDELKMNWYRDRLGIEI